MPTNCSAARQLPQFYKHSKSADLLRKSLLSHVWRVPSSKALSCKHERLFDLLTLASSLYWILWQITTLLQEKTSGKKCRRPAHVFFILPGYNLLPSKSLHKVQLRLQRHGRCCGTVLQISSHKRYLLLNGLRKLPFRFHS